MVDYAQFSTGFAQHEIQWIMARFRESKWFKGLLSRVDDGSFATGDRPLVMVPGRQISATEFDPAGFTAHELSAEAVQDPAALAQLGRLVEWHEAQLRDLLRAAVSELPAEAQTADLHLTSPERRGKVQDLAARYGLAAALAADIAAHKARLHEDSRLRGRREASADQLRQLGISPFPADFFSSTTQGPDLFLRSLSTGVITSAGRAKRDERVRAEIADLFPDTSPSARAFDPAELVENAWKAQGRTVVAQARQALHRNDGRAPTIDEIREIVRANQLVPGIPPPPAVVFFPDRQVQRSGPVARNAKQPSALKRAVVRGARRLGHGNS